MIDITIDRVNALYLYIHCDIDINYELRDALSFMMPNAWFVPKYKTGQWDGKVRFYNSATRLLPVGLIGYLIKFIKRHNYTVKWNFDTSQLSTKITQEQLIEFYKQIELTINPQSFKGSDHQHCAIQKCLNKKIGIIKSATGSGKSAVIYIITRWLLSLDRQVLLVCTTQALVLQMLSDFKEYGWKNAEKYCCTLFSGREYDETKPILISTWQSLQRKSDSFFGRFQGLLMDECLHPLTKIMTIDGEKCIKDIQIGDLVLSFNFKTKKYEYKSVTKVYKNLTNTNQLNYIEDKDGFTRFNEGITGNHPVFTKNGKKQVNDLIAGDEIEEY